MAPSRPSLVRFARGLAVGLVLLAVLSGGLLLLRSRIDTATAALVLIVPGVAAAVVGGRRTAVLVALTAALVLNVGFLRPYGTLKVDLIDELIDLVAFTGVALGAGAFVAREGERRRLAEESAAAIRALGEENAAIRGERERLAAEALAATLASEHRSALLRAVSHDLRTPLATIAAVASDLRDTTTHHDQATSEELLDLVVDETDRLDRFVGNLLNMSRVDAGALVPDRQAIDLAELLKSCVARQRRLVRDRRVAFDVPLTLPLVSADWTLVDQVLTNLLANAVRHAPPGSRIDITARRSGEQDEWVEVAVIDQGPGIPASEREAVFVPFRTGPGSQSSGIGLAIVRAVVEAHGGAVVITSADTRDPDRSGSGTRVAFTLPVHGA